MVATTPMSFRPCAVAADAGVDAYDLPEDAQASRWGRFATACALVAAAAGLATALPVSAKTNGMKASSGGDRAYCQQRARDDDTDIAACLKEMAAARSIRSTELTSPDLPTGQVSAEARCSVVPSSQRESCLMRERGVNTTTSGSVKAGGVLRETRETVPAARTPPR